MKLLLLAVLAGLSVFAGVAAAPSCGVDVESNLKALSLTAREDFPQIASELLLTIAINPTATIKAHDLIGTKIVAAAAATKTIYEHTRIILKKPKGSTDDSNTIVILPFHGTIIDYCDEDQRQVVVVYVNGDRRITVGLGRKDIRAIEHKIPGFPDFTMGKYDYNANRLRLDYKDCTWHDDETWKECGECRAAQWSGPAPNCATDGSFRTKNIDCSMILGVMKTSDIPSAWKGGQAHGGTPANNTLADGRIGNFTLMNSTLAKNTLTPTEHKHA